MTTAERAKTLEQVLSGLNYPAEKWQIVTQAEIYGADGGTRARLRALPLRSYLDCADVTRFLTDEETRPLDHYSRS
jgi:hypothetical protein